MVNPGKAKGRNHAFLSGQFLIFKGVPGFQEATSVYVYKARNLGKVAGNVRLFFFFRSLCKHLSVWKQSLSFLPCAIFLLSSSACLIYSVMEKLCVP